MSFHTKRFGLDLTVFSLALFWGLAGAAPLSAGGDGGPVTAARIPVLIKSLNENAGLSGDIVRRLEVQKKLAAYGQRDSRAVVPLIVRELDSLQGYNERAVARRIALIEVLRDIGPAAGAAVPVLTEIVSDQDRRNEWASFQAQAALTAIGTPAAEGAQRAAALRDLEDWLAASPPDEVEKALQQHDFFIRQELRRPRPNEEMIEASVLALLVAGPQAEAAAPTLLRAYNDERIGSELRGLLAKALAAVGIADLPAPAAQAAAAESGATVDPLADIIADSRSEDSLISGSAMSELARLGPAEPVIDALIEALHANNNPGAAARVLGDFGPASARAIPDLLPYLEDRDAGPNAIQALGKIGNPDPGAIRALRRILSDPTSHLRGQAAVTLGQLGAVEAIPDLATALDASRKYDRILAAKALGRMGQEAAAAVPALTRLLQDRDRDVRRAGVEALGRIGPAAAEAAPEIARQLQSSDGRLKESAEEALARIGGSEAEALLAADARRYAGADRAEYGRVKAMGGEKDLRALLRQLPEARALQVARFMLEDEEPEIAFLGSVFLIHAGRASEAVPVLVDLAARGAVEDDRFAGLGRLLVHSGDGTRMPDFTASLKSYLDSNMGRYSEEEQARIRRVFGLTP
jgi:HEAT repeat protein